MNLEMFAANIRKRRLIFLIVCIASPVALAIIVFTSTIIDTLAIPNLDQRSYDRMLNDNLIFAFFIFTLGMIIVIPIVIVLNGMFRRVLSFTNTLSIRDAEKLVLLNETEPFYNKFMPPYIIKENTVTFFKMFHQNTIRFDDIIRIDLRPKFAYSVPAFVKIDTKHGIFYYSLSKNEFIPKNLLAEALKANPKIIINENWN